jgi:hypothetical protein
MTVLPAEADIIDKIEHVRSGPIVLKKAAVATQR